GERVGQRLSIELRIMARSRHGADIHQQVDAMRSQHIQEFSGAPIGMADRPHRVLRGLPEQLRGFPEKIIGICHLTTIYLMVFCRLNPGKSEYESRTSLSDSYAPAAPLACIRGAVRARERRGPSRPRPRKTLQAARCRRTPDPFVGSV